MPAAAPRPRKKYKNNRRDVKLETERQRETRNQRRVDAVATKVTPATVHRHAQPSKQRDVKKESDRKRRQKEKRVRERGAQEKRKRERKLRERKIL